MPDPDRPYTTTDAGIPATSDEYSLTVGPAGPILLQDTYLVQKMQQFNRERSPSGSSTPRAGAPSGSSRPPRTCRQFTRAALFANGRPHRDAGPVLHRGRGAGLADTARDPRGFAVKFYTEEGNYDMVGNNTPVFFIRDPQKFQDFIHSQKRRADNHLRDNNMQWDFWTLSPESAHQVTWLMGDRGLPKTWRHMNGFSSHTYMWINAGGERFWVKYHFKTDQGIEHLTEDEGRPRWRARTPTTISRTSTGPSPRGTITHLDALRAGHALRGRRRLPLQPLRPDQGVAPWRLPADQGRDGWCSTATPRTTSPRSSSPPSSPRNMVPGIGPSPDRMLLARLFSYHDTHLHRLGANAQQLPVNRARAPGALLQPRRRHALGEPSGPGLRARTPSAARSPDPSVFGADPSWAVTGEIVRAAYRGPPSGRRLRPGHRHGQRGHGRRGPGPVGRQHRRARLARVSRSRCCPGSSSTGTTSTSRSATGWRRACAGPEGGGPPHPRTPRQWPAATARSSATDWRMTVVSSRSSSPPAHRCSATRRTIMPVSAARIACDSPTPRRRRASAMAVA